MPVRREPRPSWSYSIPLGHRRAIVGPAEWPGAPVTIQYQRYLPGGPRRSAWRPSPENTAVVSVPGAERAADMEEGKRLAREALAGLDSGAIVGEERPYVAPAAAVVVAELDHPTKMLRAIVLRRSGGYEVRTVGYVPVGYAMPVSSPSVSPDLDGEWGRLDPFERLLADTEEEAMEAARAELERLAGGDLPVRDRASGASG